MKLYPTLKNPWLLSAALGAIALTGSTAFYTLSLRPTQPASPELAPPAPARISALGRLEPEAEILQLAPPSSLENDRLLELRVKDGDTVKAGEIVAVLDSRDRLQDELRQAQAQVAISKSKLAQVRAGAKAGEILAQVSQVERLQSQRQGDLVAQRAAIATPSNCDRPVLHGALPKRLLGLSLGRLSWEHEGWRGDLPYQGIVIARMSSCIG